MFAPFFEPESTTRKKNVLQNHTHTHIKVQQTHPKVQAGSRHPQKKKNIELKISYFSKQQKVLTISNNNNNNATHQSGSENHDTNMNEMWKLFRRRRRKQTVKVQTIAKWQNIWAVGSHANALRSLEHFFFLLVLNSKIFIVLLNFVFF